MRNSISTSDWLPLTVSAHWNTYKNNVLIEIGTIGQIVAINICHRVHLCNRGLDRCVPIFSTSIGFKTVVIDIKAFGAAQITTTQRDTVLPKEKSIENQSGWRYLLLATIICKLQVSTLTFRGRCRQSPMSRCIHLFRQWYLLNLRRLPSWLHLEESPVLSPSSHFRQWRAMSKRRSTTGPAEDRPSTGRSQRAAEVGGRWIFSWLRMIASLPARSNEMKLLTRRIHLSGRMVWEQRLINSIVHVL